jgi:hypothetical protein
MTHSSAIDPSIDLDSKLHLMSILGSQYVVLSDETRIYSKFKEIYSIILLIIGNDYLMN